MADNPASSGQRLLRSRADAICQKCAIIGASFASPIAAAEPNRWAVGEDNNS